MHIAQMDLQRFVTGAGHHYQPFCININWTSVYFEEDGLKPISVMENISYKISAPLNSSAIEHLYRDAGWTNYTRDIPKLMKALKNSISVITAWDQDQLVGLIRAVGDGLVILYIQDILVLKTHKRKGIGSQLLKTMLAENEGIRQIVLLTTDTFETRMFYESLGFTACEDGNSVAFAIQR